MKSGRFDPVADRLMVEHAIETAVQAGVPPAEVDRVLAEEAALDDDFSTPITAARLSGLARAHLLRSEPPGVLAPFPGRIDP